jgi:ubiquinone/menaquinone biosynthesis C-methylase UbiE
MTTPEATCPAYIHGTGAAEQERLERQAKLLGGAEFLPHLHPGMRLLEIGCGTGAITREVAHAVLPGHVIGLDRSEVQLATAARLAAAQGFTNMRFLQGDAHHLPLPDAAFDAVYGRFVLEHVANPRQVIQELYRVVRPGGWVCAYEWEAGCIVHYPDSPAIDQVWHSIYRWQQAQGSDPWIGRKVYSLFRHAGFPTVQADGQGWAITGAARESERLQWYVDGAREIIRQIRDGLITAHFVTPDTLRQAEEEYQRLLASPETFIFHGFCRVLGIK